MIVDRKDRKEITTKKVAAHTDVPWSHTTVSPHLMQWHSERTRDEQEMLAKTKMSTHFVKALKNEVEERVSSLRQIDANQAEAMNAQLSEKWLLKMIFWKLRSNG
ncbi:Methyl-accepting chemotaxis protein containing 2 PAS and MCP domains (fragment) [Vibrio coralliirubri]